jgi:hypothetical protein
MSDKVVSNKGADSFVFRDASAFAFALFCHFCLVLHTNLVSLTVLPSCSSLYMACVHYRTCLQGD